MKAFITLVIICGTYSLANCESCDNQADGILIPVPGECTGFFICLNGEGVLSNCGPQTHFDPVTRTCIEEARSLCVNGKYKEVDQNAKIACAGRREGELVPVVGECSKFYICTGDGGSLLDCGRGLHFDPLSETCSSAATSKCVDGTTEVTIAQEKPKKKPEPKPEVKVELKPEVKPEAKPEIKLEAKPSIKQGLKPETKFEPQQVESESKPEVRPEIVPTAELNVEKRPDIKPETKPESKLDKPLDPEVKLESKPEVKPPSKPTHQNKEKPEQPKKTVDIKPTAKVSCVGQQNGMMFYSPEGCSKYFICLQERAFEQTCGKRHFDPSTKSCVDVSSSKCVEGKVINNSEAVINNVAVGQEDDLKEATANDIKDTNTAAQVDEKVSGSSNSYIVTDNKIIINNKPIVVKQTGLPVNKKPVSSNNEKLDVAVSGSSVIAVIKPVDAAVVEEGDKNVVETLDVESGDNAVVEAGDVEKENKEVVFAVMAENSDDVCVGITSGTFLSKNDSCNEFYTCEGDVAFIGKCPQGLHFNAKTNSCDWPEYAGCALNW